MNTSCFFEYSVYFIFHSALFLAFQEGVSTYLHLRSTLPVEDLDSTIKLLSCFVTVTYSNYYYPRYSRRHVISYVLILGKRRQVKIS